MFVSCHPALPAESRVALTLRLLGGLRTEEIARAFLVSEPTVAQRVVRAKRTLAALRIPFEIPVGPDRAARLSSVLEVIYLVFNEGYAATAGDGWMRQDLCHEALRLGRLLAGLAPGEAEVHGLVALMELQASRSAARTTPSGQPIALHEQNRGAGTSSSSAAASRPCCAPECGGPLGPYVLQAAIAVCHARARTARGDRLDADRRPLRVPRQGAAHARRAAQPRGRAGHGVRTRRRAWRSPTPWSPNRRSRDYHRLPSVRGDLLARLGRHEEARREFERAAALASNARERGLLLGRGHSLAD